MTTGMETYRAGDGRLASPARGIGLARCGVVKSRLIPVAADVSPQGFPFHKKSTANLRLRPHVNCSVIPVAADVSPQSFLLNRKSPAKPRLRQHVNCSVILVAADSDPRLTPRPYNPILASPSGNAPVPTHKLLSDQPVPTGAGACAEVGSRSTAHADKRLLLKSSP